MKKHLLLFVAFIVTMGFSYCTTPSATGPDSGPNFSDYTEASLTYNFTAEEQTSDRPFTFKSKSAWVVETVSPWVKLSTREGEAGDATITFSVAVNMAYGGPMPPADRTLLVIISGGGEEILITINQEKISQ